jgi:argininosuccinate lyase
LGADGRTLQDATAGELQAAHPQLVPEDLDDLTPEGSVAARATPGGGSMESVRHQLAELRQRLSS